MQVQLAQTDEQIKKCWFAIQALRPHLQEEELVPTVRSMMGEGFMLAFIEEDGIAVSIIGFRYLHFLFNGKHFYIDDLSTLPEHRSKGHASQLLDFVKEMAIERGYNMVTLDSGHHRYTAHRLYLNKGYTIIGHHFTLDLKK